MRDHKKRGGRPLCQRALQMIGIGGSLLSDHYWNSSGQTDPLIDRGAEPSQDVQRLDARKAFQVMVGGGVAVLPLSVSYAIFAHTASGVERIYALKQRPQTKPNGVIGNRDIFREEIAHTVAAPEEVEDEIRHLFRALAD